MKVSHAMTAIAALAAMDGVARAGPLATPPGRRNSGLETAPADIGNKEPNSTDHDGSVPVATVTIPEAVAPQPTDHDNLASSIMVTIPVVETPVGYDFGTATYSAPDPSVTAQREPNSSLPDPVGNSKPTSKVTAAPIPSNQLMPLGPIVDPFDHFNPDLATIAPIRADSDAANETVSPSPLPDVRVVPMAISDEEGGSVRRQVPDNDRDAIPMSSRVPEEKEDS